MAIVRKLNLTPQVRIDLPDFQGFTAVPSLPNGKLFIDQLKDRYLQSIVGRETISRAQSDLALLDHEIERQGYSTPGLEKCRALLHGVISQCEERMR